MPRSTWTHSSIVWVIGCSAPIAGRSTRQRDVDAFALERLGELALADGLFAIGERLLERRA